MSADNYREFRSGNLHHVYLKGLCGNVIFYTRNDCLYFFTLFCCLARKYGIKLVAICIMPNHVHSAVEAPNRTSFFTFNARLESVFCQEFNARRNRRGSLFQSPFGFAPKIIGKKIRDTISYIANNPVVGKLSEDVLSYKWNFLAYNNCRYPFSNNIMSSELRKAKTMVSARAKENKPMNYIILDKLFSTLDVEEAKCLTDYVISTYNILDYKAMMAYYSVDFQQIVSLLNANGGSEYDISEDYENYSFYTMMSRLSIQLGIDIGHCNFSDFEKSQLEILEEEFRKFKIPRRQIEKFLHKTSDEQKGGAEKV